MFVCLRAAIVRISNMVDATNQPTKEAIDVYLVAVFLDFYQILLYR
jgi:hypothetical protein